MRGEDVRHQEHRRVFQGSPPHARGRHLDDRVWVRGERITPACAGKTSLSLSRGIVMGDHPRMRGEDGGGAALPSSLIGSPPHARGRPLDQLKSAQDHGITPACAGKTSSMPTASTPRTDHPRMRGEDGVGRWKACCQEGSPPHARGRRRLFAAWHVNSRITPACAGKTA